MRFTLLSMLLCCFQLLSAQSHIVISGTITDADNGRPLAYAHVGIPERGIGTTAGEDGSFTLKAPEQYAQSKLSVSFIGYATYERSLSALQSPVNIRLKAVPTSLQEVIVMDESAVEDIIRRAVRRIPDNYPDRPSSSTAFYRESRTNAQMEYLYIAEGVLNIYKTSYRNDKEGQVGLIQGRKVILSGDDETVQHPGFSSGHMAAHRFDFVKNREDFIDESYFPEYQYWIENITTYEGRPVYVIRFDKAEGGKGRMKGALYIDTLSYAFLRAQFEILPEGLSKANDYPLYSGSWKANRYTVNYRKVDGAWYFSNALREGVYRDGGIYSNEITSTELQTGRGKPVPYIERLDRGDEFLDITGSYDEAFWRDYNTTPLSAALQTAVQVRNQEKAQEVFDSTFIVRLQTRRDSVLRSQESGSEFMGKVTPPMEKADGFKWRFQSSVGLGAHFLETQAADMRLAYLESADGPAILESAGRLNARSFEPTYHLEFSLFFKPHLFIRGGWSRDLYNSIYRERSLGLGTQFNLSKGRPLFVRAIAQHSNHKYARLLGQANNDYGKFKAEGKKINANKVNMYYGSRTHNLKLSMEMALELNPGLEFFVRGSYWLPFARQQHIYLKERQQLFPKKVRIPLSDEVLVERNGEAFDGRITENQSLAVTVGLVFK